VRRTEELRLPDRIVDEEVALHDRVRRHLEQRTEKPRDDERSLERELEGLREQIVSGRERKDALALTDQWHRQSALLEQLRRSRSGPEVDPRSPYFAHLRLRENGRDRDLCLGRATCIENGVRIVDWRHAPVSKIFYRYQQGDEYEEEFGGQPRAGVVAARRSVRIRDGRLDRIEAPEGVFLSGPGGWRRVRREQPRLFGGAGSALRAYGEDDAGPRRLGTDLAGNRRRADKRLPEITGLIDPLQFDLITRAGGYLAIRGNAGSGKTTVALHRIAYLAYDDPEIDSDRTLFVVFSPALRDYVGTVLPSLGVTGVRIVTYRDWAHEQRRRHFPDLPAAVRADAPAAIQRLKLDPALLEALARHVDEHPGPRSVRQAVDDWASVLTRPDLLRECVERRTPDAYRPAVFEQFADTCRRRNEELFAWLEGDAETEAELDPEDDALLLRAWQLRVGPLLERKQPLRYRHVAIDEVQDFSPLEVRVLIDCLDERRSLTLAGDTQQHVHGHTGFTSWGRFLTELGVEGDALETLRVSYRSSQEIATFAHDVLGSLREDEEPPRATRSGPPVELFRFTDRGACVAFLADALRDLARAEPLASVAVLAPSPEMSAVYHDGLEKADLPNLRRVAKQDFSFAPGVEVTEIEQAKGLEFDYVVLADATAEHYPDTPEARRRLHVGATRAVHQLWITSVGTPSPLLGALEGKEAEASRPTRSEAEPSEGPSG
jgi:DNA helicase-2/ATP-dependent DNA helicase PcrA